MSSSPSGGAQHQAQGTEYWEYGTDDREQQFYPAEGMPSYSGPSDGGYLDVKARPEFYDPAGSHLAVQRGTPVVYMGYDASQHEGHLSAFRGTARTDTTIDATGIVSTCTALLQSAALDEQFSRIKDEARISHATFGAANDPVNMRKVTHAPNIVCSLSFFCTLAPTRHPICLFCSRASCFA